MATTSMEKLESAILVLITPDVEFAGVLESNALKLLTVDVAQEAVEKVRSDPIALPEVLLALTR